MATMTALRGDPYPQTERGLEDAVFDLVPRVEFAQCLTLGPGRAIIYVSIDWPIWSLLLFGLYRWIVRRRVQRVVNMYGAAGIKIEVRVE